MNKIEQLLDRMDVSYEVSGGVFTFSNDSLTMRVMNCIGGFARLETYVTGSNYSAQKPWAQTTKNSHEFSFLVNQFLN